MNRKSIISHPFYPWLVIILCALFLFYKYILQVSPSIMVADLMRAFSVTGAGLGNLAACYFYTYLVMQVPAGILLDRYSPRYLTAFAIGVCGIGAWLFASTSSLHIAEFARGLIGFGAAFATVSYLKMATLWFPPQRFSLIAGLLATAAMLGAIGGQAPLALIVNRIGWQQTIIYSAFLGFVLAFLFWLFARDLPAEQAKIPTQKTSLQSFFKDLSIVLKSRQNWLLSFYSGLAFSPIDVFAGLWGVPYLMQAHHISNTFAALEASSAFVGLAIGAPIIGWFSDRIGKRTILMKWGTFLSLISILGVLYLPYASSILTIILLFLFGLGTSSFMLGFTVGTELNKKALAATVVALINTCDGLWGAISEPLIGKLLDWGWTGEMLNNARVFSTRDYHLALLLLPIYLVFALFLLFFIKEPVKKLEGI